MINFTVITNKNVSLITYRRESISFLSRGELIIYNNKIIISSTLEPNQTYESLIVY